MKINKKKYIYIVVTLVIIVCGILFYFNANKKEVGQDKVDNAISNTALTNENIVSSSTVSILKLSTSSTTPKNNSMKIDSKTSECIEDYKKRYPDPEQYSKGYVVVGFSDSISLLQAEQIINSYGLLYGSLDGGKYFTNISGKSFYVYVIANVKVGIGDEFLWSCRLEQDSRIRYAEPSPIATVAS